MYVTLGLPRCAGDVFKVPTLNRVIGFVMGHGVIGRALEGQWLAYSSHVGSTTLQQGYTAALEFSGDMIIIIFEFALRFVLRW